MKFKHTQGGWNRNIAPVSKYPIIFAGRNSAVAQIVTCTVTAEEAEANANLIAATPDLLEVVAAMANFDGRCNNSALKKMARDALAKATQ